MSHWVVELFQVTLSIGFQPSMYSAACLPYFGNVSHGAGQPIGNLSKGYHAIASVLLGAGSLPVGTSHLIGFIRNKLYIRGRLSYPDDQLNDFLRESGSPPVHFSALNFIPVT